MPNRKIRLSGVRSLSGLADVLHTICHDGHPGRVALCAESQARLFRQFQSQSSRMPMYRFTVCFAKCVNEPEHTCGCGRRGTASSQMSPRSRNWPLSRSQPLGLRHGALVSRRGARDRRGRRALWRLQPGRAPPSDLPAGDRSGATGLLPSPQGRPPSERSFYSSPFVDVHWTPLFPFGHGLGYTTFSHGPPSLSAARIRASDTVVVEVGVANDGDREGDSPLPGQWRLTARPPTRFAAITSRPPRLRRGGRVDFGGYRSTHA